MLHGVPGSACHTTARQPQQGDHVHRHVDVGATKWPGTLRAVGHGMVDVSPACSVSRGSPRCRIVLIHAARPSARRARAALRGSEPETRAMPQDAEFARARVPEFEFIRRALCRRRSASPSQPEAERSPRCARVRPLRGEPRSATTCTSSGCSGERWFGTEVQSSAASAGARVRPRRCASRRGGCCRSWCNRRGRSMVIACRRPGREHVPADPGCRQGAGRWLRQTASPLCRIGLNPLRPPGAGACSMSVASGVCSISSGVGLLVAWVIHVCGAPTAHTASHSAVRLPDRLHQHPAPRAPAAQRAPDRGGRDPLPRRTSCKSLSVVSVTATRPLRFPAARALAAKRTRQSEPSSGAGRLRRLWVGVDVGWAVGALVLVGLWRWLA